MPSLTQLEQHQQQYQEQQEDLKRNLDVLFNRFRSRLSGENAAALINLRRTGYTLLSETDFFLFPPFIVASNSELNDRANYQCMTDIYRCANVLIDHLCKEQLNQEDIDYAKNALQNTITAKINKHSGCQRLVHGLEAFCSAIILVAGIALIVVAAATPVGIGAAIGLSLMGLFGAVIGGTRAAYSAGHANNILKKDNDQFSSAAQSLCQAVAPRLN